MAPKKTHDAAKAKAAKEKKILLALSLPLLGALFFAYHTVTGLHHSSAPPPVPAAATTPATTPATTTLNATASTVVPPTSTGLTSFGRLAPKDPFHDHGPHASASSGPSAGTSTLHDPGSKTSTKTTAKATKQPAPPPTSAVIAVNRQLTMVLLGATFPVTTDPLTNGLFHLVGLTAKTAKIAVTGGSYANGAHKLTLTVGTEVTLVNTADGRRYTLRLLPQGTVAPTTATGSATPTTTTPGG